MMCVSTLASTDQDHMNLSKAVMGSIKREATLRNCRVVRAYRFDRDPHTGLR
jgi:hypothetical protein